MGLRGPAPTPTAIREAEGMRGHRPLPAKEPQYDTGMPVPPRRMSRGARALWEELSPQLMRSRVLTRVDGRALWQLCEDEAILEEVVDGIWKSVRSAKLQIAKKRKFFEEQLRRDDLKASERSALEDALAELAPGGPLLALIASTNGRLAMSAISQIAGRTLIQRREFGLTPSSRTRVETLGDAVSALRSVDSIEAKLAG